MNSTQTIELLYPISFVYVMSTAGVAAALALLFVLYLVWRDSLGESKLRKRARLAATPFNISLLIIAVSLVGMYTSQAIWFTAPLTSAKAQFAKMFVVLFLSLFEACYIYYSGLRAAAVVDDVVPSMVGFFLAFTKYAPPLFILQVAPSVSLIAINFNHSEVVDYTNFVFIICSATATISFDSFLLFVFVKFMRRTVGHADSIDAKFLIIARHGICAIIAGMASLLSYVVYYLFMEVFLLVTQLLLGVVFLVLVHMKMALKQNEVTVLADQRSKISKARQLNLGDVDNSAMKESFTMKMSVPKMS